MYVLIVIGLLVVVMLVEISVWNLGSSLTMLIDAPSLVLLMIIGVSMLLAAGLGKDFLAAFRLALGKEKQAVGLRERKRAVEAVELFMKTMRYGGVFSVILQLIAISSLMKDVAMWGIYLSVIFVALVYAYAVNLLLLPVKSRLNLGIIEYVQGVESEDDGGKEAEGKTERGNKTEGTEGVGEGDGIEGEGGAGEEDGIKGKGRVGEKEGVEETDGVEKESGIERKDRVEEESGIEGKDGVEKESRIEREDGARDGIEAEEEREINEEDGTEECGDEEETDINEEYGEELYGSGK